MKRTLRQAAADGARWIELKCTADYCRRAWMREIEPIYKDGTSAFEKFGPDAVIEEIEDRCGWCGAGVAKVVRVIIPR